MNQRCKSTGVIDQGSDSSNTSFEQGKVKSGQRTNDQQETGQYQNTFITKTKDDVTRHLLKYGHHLNGNDETELEKQTTIILLSFNLLCDPNVDLYKLNHHASEDTKVRAVWTYLWLEKTQAEVASFYAIHQSTLSRWISQAFKPEATHLKDISILDEDDRRFILTTLEQTPDLYLREIVDLLVEVRNKVVSVTTIHRFLIHSGYSWKRCQILVKRAKEALLKLSKTECI
ncbi:hypothetical protein GEMRC1_003309 [Eukaryota sp. GEM-RC1]